jgi:hypothetical protein
MLLFFVEEVTPQGGAGDGNPDGAGADKYSQSAQACLR